MEAPIYSRGSFQLRLDGQREHFRTEERLGEGAFGIVYKVRDTFNKAYAIKDIKCSSQSDYESANNEVESLINLHHNHIMKIFAVDTYYEGTNHVCILMEFCAGGTLNGRLEKDPSIDMKLTWMVQIADALRYLHDHGLVHRDLKPDNVLLTLEQDVKLADFGLAREYVAWSGGGQPNQEDWMAGYLKYYMGTFAGTPFWIAPEVFDRHYTQKADVFSLGVILYAICERDYVMYRGSRLFGAYVEIGNQKIGLGTAMAQINPNSTVTFRSTVGAATEPAKELILSILQFFPDKRPTADQVYERISDIRRGYFDSLLDRQRQSERVEVPMCQWI